MFYYGGVQKKHYLNVINFEEHTNEENLLIQEEINLYYNVGVTKKICSCDKTRSAHSKLQTKNRNNARKAKGLV